MPPFPWVVGSSLSPTVRMAERLSRAVTVGSWLSHFAPKPSPMTPTPRNEALVFVGVAATVIGCLAALAVVPEVRDFLHLDERYPDPVGPTMSQSGAPTTPTPAPSRVVPTPERAESRLAHLDALAERLRARPPQPATSPNADFEAYAERLRARPPQPATPPPASPESVEGALKVELLARRLRGEPPKVALVFRVTPPDAAVYVDRLFAGRADGTIVGEQFEASPHRAQGELTVLVTPGRHRIELVRPGFEAREYNSAFDTPINVVRATLPRG